MADCSTRLRKKAGCPEVCPDLDGLGWGHCRAVGWTVEIPFGGAHTPAESLDPSSASTSAFSSSSLFLFCKANHFRFWLEEDISCAHFAMAVRFRIRWINNQGKGVMLWNRLVLWSGATTDYFTFISNNLHFSFMPLCAGASMCMLWHIGQINHWIQSISQWHYFENELCSQCVAGAPAIRLCFNDNWQASPDINRSRSYWF